MPPRRRPLPVLLVLLTACGPGTAATEPGTTGGSSTGEPTTGSSQPTGSTGAPTTGDPDPTVATASTTGEHTTGEHTTDQDTTSEGTTADTTTGTTDTTSAPDDTDSGGVVCPAPGPDGAQVSWSLEIDGAPADASVKADCKVLGAEVQGQETAASLTCEIDGASKSVVLRYSFAPEHAIPWGPQQPTVLDYRREQPWWLNEWLTVDSGGGVSFGAIRADALTPPGLTTFEFFGRDFSIGDACTPEPDRCGQRQGRELIFPLPEGEPAAAKVKSGEHSSMFFFPLVVVWVEHASRLLEPIVCDDVPSSWIDAIVLEDCANC